VIGLKGWLKKMSQQVQEANIFSKEDPDEWTASTLPAKAGNAGSTGSKALKKEWPEMKISGLAYL
jgi:hypothetical protein